MSSDEESATLTWYGNIDDVADDVEGSERKIDPEFLCLISWAQHIRCEWGLEFQVAELYRNAYAYRQREHDGSLTFGTPGDFDHFLSFFTGISVGAEAITKRKASDDK